VTNLDRVLAPGRPGEPPITKRDLIRYLVAIGPVMLPHLASRALNVVRFPDGVDKPPFWQRDLGRNAPAWVARWHEPDPPDRQPHVYALADGVPTLAWLGNMGAVELHPWTSLIDRPDEPRWALVDIDPERLAESELVASKLIRTLGVKARIETHTDQRAALDRADFVIVAFQIGGYEPCTVTDFEVPKKFGLRHTIADTLGVGGLALANAIGVTVEVITLLFILRRRLRTPISLAPIATTALLNVNEE